MENFSSPSGNNRKKIVEEIFEQLDVKNQGFLVLEELAEALELIKEANRKVVLKYVNWYKRSVRADKITKASFVELMMSKKRTPSIVHVRLSDLLDFDTLTKKHESFSQRLKKRLNSQKYKLRMEEPIEYNELDFKDCCNDPDHCEKPKWKTAKERNYEELISIRRCHLLYS